MIRWSDEKDQWLKENRGISIFGSVSMTLPAPKRKAEEEGVPYQTLIASVLHKYIRDRLVDEKDILKSLQLLTVS